MRKTDVIFAFLAGWGVAWLFFGLLRGQGVKITFPLFLVLFFLLPALSLAGLWVSWLLGKKFLWIFQAAKFFLMGVLATLVDLGVLNLLIWISGTASGLSYSLFKGVSFLAAMMGKYFGVKLWTFEKTGMAGAGKEFAKFLTVSVVGLGINVIAASFIVNTIGPQFGITEKIWANIGAILAAFATFVWNFVGSKFIVFKK